LKGNEPLPTDYFLNCQVDSSIHSSSVPPPVIFKKHGSNKGFVQRGFETEEIDEDSFVTDLKGTKYDIALDLFGSDHHHGRVKLPRLPMNFLAEFRMLRETLKHNLEAYRDGLFPRSSNGSDSVVLDAIQGPPLFGTDFSDWEDLLRLIEMNENGETANEAELLKKLVDKGVISDTEWSIISNYAFLEYYPIYAYNNFDAYEVLGNKHEGDIEGCCLVFERSQIEQAANSENRQEMLDKELLPKFIITSAHKESFDDDDIRRISNASLEAIWEDLIVWVSLGSHASRIAGPGEFEVLPYEDPIEFGVVTGVIIICFFVPQYCIAAAILALILRNTLPPMDKTSDKGVHAQSSSSGDLSTSSPTNILPKTEVTPLSQEYNIYLHPMDADPDCSSSLGERSFPGRWGAHKGKIHDSPGFTNKTKRYLKKLTWYLNK